MIPSISPKPSSSLAVSLSASAAFSASATFSALEASFHRIAAHPSGEITEEIEWWSMEIRFATVIAGTTSLPRGFAGSGDDRHHQDNW